MGGWTLEPSGAGFGGGGLGGVSVFVHEEFEL